MLFLFSGCTGNLEDYPDSSSVFHATFGSSPPKSVTNLQASGRAFRDSSTCYLRFNASYGTVQTLIGSSFSEITPTAFATNTSNAGISGPTPGWWKPAPNPTTKFYTSSAFHPSFFSGTAYLTYDSANQLAHFYWDGID